MLFASGAVIPGAIAPAAACTSFYCLFVRIAGIAALSLGVGSVALLLLWCCRRGRVVSVIVSVPVVLLLSLTRFSVLPVTSTGVL